MTILNLGNGTIQPMSSITIIYAEKFIGVVNRTRMIILGGFVNEWTGHACSKRLRKFL